MGKAAQGFSPRRTCEYVAPIERDRHAENTAFIGHQNLIFGSPGDILPDFFKKRGRR
jgi:hypothetical protein